MRMWWKITMTKRELEAIRPSVFNLSDIVSNPIYNSIYTSFINIRDRIW